MRPRFRAFSRYRPRVLTLVVLFLIAAPITLANFTSEIIPIGSPRLVSYRGNYGWPLRWHWHEVLPTMGPNVIAGWDYSPNRLAGNVALWLLMLAVPAGACEWLLRRYRPRLRWSLRTMLAGVAVAALCCAWFAAARNRAELQDSIIAELGSRDFVAVERPGPKWLEFVMPDRFRRRIVGVDMRMHGTVDEAFVVRLGRLPRLKYLNLHVERLTPKIASALRNSRQLRWLYFHEGEPSLESLAVLRELTQLKGLCLYRAALTSDSIACLAGLTNLKTFTVFNCTTERAFSQMPALPQLEAIQVVFSSVSGADLRRLAALPRLKALDLKYADFGADADFGDLAGLDSLEELTVDGDDLVSAEAIESLAAIKHLKSLHITERDLRSEESGEETAIKLDDGEELAVTQRELDAFRRALQNLRRSHPGIVIDGNAYAIDEHFEQEPPWDAIKYQSITIAQRKPPWDRLEKPVLLSAWLPARFNWAPPTLLSQFGARASGLEGGSKQAGDEAACDE